MSDISAESPNESQPDLDVTTADVTAVMPAESLSTSQRRRARLNDAGNAVASAAARARQSAGPPVQNAVNKAGAKTGPLVDRAQPYRAHIIAAVAAIAAVVAVVLRRRGSTPAIEETPVDLGDWHLTAEPTLADNSH